MWVHQTLKSSVCLRENFNMDTRSRGVLAIGGLSLEEQLSKFPACLLDVPCAESHLGKLVHLIDTESMVLLATDLGLTDVEVKDVREIWPKKPAVQRLEMFKTWQQKNQSQATYRWVCIISSNRAELIS